METGTVKTLVYLRTIYELYQRYRLTKFIIKDRFTIPGLTRRVAD